ncbi:aldo/keto reductase [Streptomyces lydicus]|uniref:aldo/keto reductase n=1 Tax=Streptomyces lydicus TaxID=47763 RepID=UPI0036E7402A
MQKRTLGRQGLEVSAIGYGAMGLTMAYGPTDEEAGVAALRRAHDLGITFFDTAEMYGWGTGSNEILVGKAVRDFREDVVLASKFGVDMSVPPEQIGGALNSRPDNIRKSLFERDAETLFPTLEELGVGFVAYSPLGRGFITGTAKPAGQYEATDIRTVDPRWQPGNFEKNVEAVDRLAELAATKGATVSQLALAWLLTRGEHIVPIPGTRSPKRIEDNAGAADLTLTDTDLKAIDEILPHGGFGARYTEGHVPTWI